VESSHQRHAAQMYAEMLGQAYKSKLYMSMSDPDGYQEAFVFHARHTTFYIFYTKIPNRYLKDIAMYGANYRNHIAEPDQIIIQHSKPYSMRLPKHQAAFFRLLANVLYYILSGSSRVGVLAAQPWNPYYCSNAMNAIPEEPEELNQQIETRPIYDQIKVRPYGEQQIPIAAEEMDEEGEVDDEPDVNDSDLDEDERIEAMAAGLISDDDVIASRSVSREGSPMDWSSLL